MGKFGKFMVAGKWNEQGLGRTEKSSDTTVIEPSLQSYNIYIKCKIIDKNMMITIEKEGWIIYPHKGTLHH
jgi:hypothetical protein